MMKTPLPFFFSHRLPLSSCHRSGRRLCDTDADDLADDLAPEPRPRGPAAEDVPDLFALGEPLQVLVAERRDAAFARPALADGVDHLRVRFQVLFEQRPAQAHDGPERELP